MQCQLLKKLEVESICPSYLNLESQKMTTVLGAGYFTLISCVYSAVKPSVDVKVSWSYKANVSN